MAISGVKIVKNNEIFYYFLTAKIKNIIFYKNNVLNINFL